MAFAHFLVTGVQDGAGGFRQRDIDSVVGREIVPQFPNAAQQRRVRVTLGGQRRERREKLLAAMRIVGQPLVKEKAPKRSMVRSSSRANRLLMCVGMSV